MNTSTFKIGLFFQEKRLIDLIQNNVRTTEVLSTLYRKHLLQFTTPKSKNENRIHVSKYDFPCRKI